MTKPFFRVIIVKRGEIYMEITQIMNYVYLAVAVISAILAFLSTMKGKIGKKAKDISSQISTIIPIIEDAEAFENYSGLEKLNYVLTKYRLFCVENKLVFNEDAVKSVIERIINFTKNVNAKQNTPTESNDPVKNSTIEVQKIDV